MLLAWSCIGIVDSSLFLVTDYILCILGLKLIGLFLAILIEGGKCGSFLCDCLLYCLFKRKGKEYTVCLRGYQKTGNCCINLAVFGDLCSSLTFYSAHLILYAIALKRSLAIFQGIQCKLLEFKSKLRIAGACAEDFLCCKSNFSGNGDQILTSGLLNGISNAVHLKGIFVITYRFFIAVFDVICYFCISSRFIGGFAFQGKNCGNRLCGINRPVIFAFIFKSVSYTICLKSRISFVCCKDELLLSGCRELASICCFKNICFIIGSSCIILPYVVGFTEHLALTIRTDHTSNE